MAKEKVPAAKAPKAKAKSEAAEQPVPKKKATAKAAPAAEKDTPADKAAKKPAAKGLSKTLTFQRLADEVNKKFAAKAKADEKEFEESEKVERREVAAVFEVLGELVKEQLGKKGPGVFTIPGMLKLRRITKPATKATTKPNPFRPGEMMDVKAKPARNQVKAQPLKSLKDLLK